MKRAAALALTTAALAACPRPAPLALPDPPARPVASAVPAGETCGGLHAEACARARGMLAAASGATNVRHEYILDPTSSFAAGRGLSRGDDGLWSAIPTACAKPHDGGPAHPVDATTIDVGFVGVAVDGTMLSADVDLGPYFSAGGSAGVHTLRLVAIAFVRDLDPQFFDASDDVTYAGDSACACGRASHFVGAVKMGGMLSYDVEVRAAEAHGRAFALLSASLAAHDARVRESRVGGLEVDGLDQFMDASGPPKSAHPLRFKVANPVPLAYAVYPLADVCKFALPEPQVTPDPVDFGDVAYGREASRLLHVVNRAAIDVVASYHGASFPIPARGSLDIPATWTPEGDGVGCEGVAREETILFEPADAKVPVTPKQQAVRVVERARAGRGTTVERRHADTGAHRSPDYKAAGFDSACPPDYAVSSCRTENAQCGDSGGGACRGEGYALTAVQSGNGCRFGCTGPTSLIMPSNFCRFDGVTECRLRCPP